MAEKVVEIPIEEFQELVNELKKCREDKKKLIETVNFLNEEIEEYNQKYAKPSQESKDS
jgi:uncharacterized coiled-coil DUF342 family protein